MTMRFCQSEFMTCSGFVKPCDFDYITYEQPFCKSEFVKPCDYDMSGFMKQCDF
ncbi:hypothetical protein HanIR_Chr10g0481981 [Helianthus annuus]|nr:hypothetical protein HanIR_Chr10g0481981 [Helianthus annuus]